MAKRILRDWHGRFKKGTARFPGSGRRSGNQFTSGYRRISSRKAPSRPFGARVVRHVTKVGKMRAYSFGLSFWFGSN